MDKRLNYRKLLKKWMQFYSLPAEISKKMFMAIWTRLQAPIGKSGKKGEGNNETLVE